MTLKRTLGLVVVLSAAAAGGYWVLGRGKTDSTIQADTVTVTRGSLVESASASGKIEPQVFVEVKSRASGEVIEVRVKEGDAVKAGDLLVVLDPADAERALKEARVAQQRTQADLGQAQASLQVASLQSKESQTAAQASSKGKELGLVSDEAERGASTSAAVASANVAVANAQLASAIAAVQQAAFAVEDAERRLSETSIVAPVDGTVLGVDVEKGTIVASALTNVSGGSPVVTIADLENLRVIGSIDEAQIGRVAVGQPVTIRVDAYPNRGFKGKVDRVAPLGEEVSSVVTFDVEIVVTDPDANLLKSGMSADLEIVTRRKENALTVPLMAIQSQGRGRFVRLASGEQREIETGLTDGMHIEIVSGLEEGDEVQIGGSAPTKEKERGGGPMPFGRPRR